jgi:hypothetical protein
MSPAVIGGQTLWLALLLAGIVTALVAPRTRLRRRKPTPGTPVLYRPGGANTQPRPIAPSDQVTPWTVPACLETTSLDCLPLS